MSFIPVYSSVWLLSFIGRFVQNGTDISSLDLVCFEIRIDKKPQINCTVQTWVLV